MISRTTLLLVALSLPGLPKCDRCNDDPPSGTPAATVLLNGPADVAPFGLGGGDWAWESRGIGGGGALLAAAINHHDPNDLTISTDMGVVFRSTDWGRSWFGLHFDEIRGGEFATPRWTGDPDVAYSIDDRDWRGRFLVRTTDAGLTWERLTVDPTSGEAWWIHTHPERTDLVLVTSWETLYASTDGGQTFEVAHSAPREAGFYPAGVFYDGDTIIVGSGYELVVSTDAGATWEAQPYPGLPDDLSVGSMTGATDGETTRLWIVTRAVGEVWPGIRQHLVSEFHDVRAMNRGVDDGFRPLTIQPSFAPFAVASSANDIDTVYLSGGRTDAVGPDIHRSRDGGATWERTFVSERNANIHTGWCGRRGDLDFWFSDAPLTLAVSATDSSRVVFGDFGFVHVSADGGTTWRQAYVDVDDQNPAGRTTPKGRAYRGIGLENTSSWWLHWHEDVLFAGFSDIRGISSTDGGRSWRSGRSAGLPDNSTYHVVEGPDGRLYAATSTIHDLYQSTFLEDVLIDHGDGHVLASDDGGVSWDVLHEMRQPVIWLALDPSNPGRMYAALVDSDDGGIFVTDAVDDAEAPWTRLALPPRTEGHPYNVHVLDDGALVTTWSGRQDEDERFTESSGVFLSEDGGRTWSDRTHRNMLRWTKDLVVDPHDPSQNTWYVAVFSHWGDPPNEVGGIYRTRDRGMSWARISDLYRVESLTISPDDPDLAYVATEDAGLWKTTDLQAEAPTFAVVPDYPFEHPTRTFFSPVVPGEIWVTSFGGGLRVLPASEPDAGSAEAE